MGTHLGHVLVSFMNTPDKAGLLAVAQAEAGIAAQHAALAARGPDNLKAMQTHAGHVLHALDPELVASGPGKGYGLKKAATGVAAHIELAAKAEGASAGVKTHSGHVATAARSTVARADEAIAVAQKIQAATDAAAAATLVTQLVSLCEQLTAGADVNADGQIGLGRWRGRAAAGGAARQAHAGGGEAVIAAKHRTAKRPRSHTVIAAASSLQGAAWRRERSPRAQQLTHRLLFFAPSDCSSAMVSGNGRRRCTGPLAMSTVVCPRRETARTSAPLLTRYLIISLSPRAAAWCSGVKPLLSRAFTSAPSSSTR